MCYISFCLIWTTRDLVVYGWHLPYALMVLSMPLKEKRRRVQLQLQSFFETTFLDGGGGAIWTSSPLEDLSDAGAPCDTT